MTSFPVEGEQEINNLFHKAGLEILAMDKHSVVGEYEKTCLLYTSACYKIRVNDRNIRCDIEVSQRIFHACLIVCDN